MRRAAATTARAWAMLLALGVATAALAQATPPAPVTARAILESRPLTIGTPFRYTIELAAPAGVELELPQLNGAIGDFQIVDFGQEPDGQSGGKTVIRRWYQLVTYQTGEQTVPGPSIRYHGLDGEEHWVGVPDATVVVQSLVDAAGATPPSDVHDIKGPLAKPRDYTPLLWIGAAVLAVLGLLVVLVRRLRRPQAAAAVPPRPLHELALEALDRLQAAGLIDAGQYEEFYVRLSAIVREYIEARFRLRAPEMTTEEFLQAAQRRAQLAPSHRALLGHFLGEADLVKFARHHPTPGDAERAFAAGREFVRSTAPEEPRAAA
ncbi:MAG TPA: hypothetical protein VL049_17640 [Candidatus Dormibacteraeota bacterium]|nr:hypothetical protein [Candidatus Dormibacteraeota bacterium]